MSDSPVRTRFAPSPTGHMHLGNVRTALFSWLFARKSGGEFVLRIEDTDEARSREEYTGILQQDLEWLGYHWDIGPGPGVNPQSFRQSARGGIYADLYVKLLNSDHAYPCFCTPEQLTASREAQIRAGRPPRYDGTCARLSAAERQSRINSGVPHTLRFRIPENRKVVFEDLVRGPQLFQAADIGDFIIRRADGTPAFFFCNAADDALTGITHVLRGEDHLSNTPRQLLLLEALGLAAPRYGHLPLLLGSDSTPLSKRHGSMSVASLREQGYLPDGINNYLARLGHHYEDDGFMSPDALASGFSIARMGRAPARMDETQLLHWQKEALMRLDEPAARSWLTPALKGLVPESKLERFVSVFRHNVAFPAEAAAWAHVVFDAPPKLDTDGRAQIVEAGPGFFEAALKALEGWQGDPARFLELLKAEGGRKGPALFKPLRLALTGSDHGPELAGLLQLIPGDLLHDRLRYCQKIAAH